LGKGEDEEWGNKDYKMSQLGEPGKDREKTRRGVAPSFSS